MLRPWRVFVTLASLLCASAAQAGTAAQQDSWQALEDPSGRLTFEEILSPRLSADFQAVDSDRIRTTGNSSAVWLRQQLSDNRELQYLQIIAPFLSTLDLYVMQAGQLLQHTRSGGQQSALERKDFLQAIPQSSQPLTLYIRLNSPYTLRPLITVAPASELLANEERTVLLAGLLGALAMLILYNLLRFLQQRNAASFWLTLCLTTILLSSMHLLGMVPDWLSLLQPMQGPLGNLTILLAMFCMLGFFRSLLAWPKPNDRAQRLLGLAMAAIAMCLPLPLFLDPTHATLLIMLTGCLTLTLLGIATYLYRQDCSITLRFAAAALATGALFSISGIGFFYSVRPFTWLNQTYWLVAGTLLACVFLSLALTARQLRQLRENIIALRQRAERRSEIKAKTAFLGRISHDIRSPLNGVLGMTELMLATPLSNKQRDYAQTIRSAGHELLNLLSQILDVSRLESGMIELDKDAFDYPALLDDCLDMFRHQAEQQGIELISQFQPGVAQWLYSDPARVRQVILSLLEHALRRSAAGEILLLSETDNSSPQPRLRLSVHDGGPLLSASERNHLLHAQLHDQDFLDADYHGGHLPLVIARQLVQMLGGDFGVNTDPTSGNCLWICLPMQPAATPEPAPELPAAELQGIRILVVDDNQTCRKVLVEQCQHWGMHASAAASGSEALALLRSKASLDQAFDVVLLDQQMPGMSGMQLAVKIKTDQQLLNAPLLIMLSGISDAPGKLATRNAGIRRMLAKPVAGYTLHSVLRSELGKRNTAAAVECHGQNQTLSALRVLVAEDDIISVKVIAAMLEKLGVQPDIVDNGAQALGAMQGQAYDLVLMDCEMPVMDGFTATEKMREWEQSQQRRHTPIVALTAHILAEHKERARHSGMDQHIGKPLELSQLREVVEHWTAAKRAGREEFHDKAHDAAKPPL